MPQKTRALINVRMDRRAEGDASRVRTFVATSSAVATDGGVLLPDGLDLSAFMPRPVVLWAHRDKERGIGRVIAWRRIAQPDGWECDVEFAPPQVSQDADDCLRFMDWAGFGAMSIGWDFLEVDWTPPAAELVKYGLPRHGWIGRRWRLTEVSIVNCQADPNALLKRVVQDGVLGERQARDLFSMPDALMAPPADPLQAMEKRIAEWIATNCAELGSRLGEVLDAIVALGERVATLQPKPAQATSPEADPIVAAAEAVYAKLLTIAEKTNA